MTSQIFSNVYLNELDRYVKHTLRIKHYLRYGDDFVIFVNDREAAAAHRAQVKAFLLEELCLDLHGRNDVIFPCSSGLKFLGCMLYPTHRQLQKRVWNRVLARTDRRSVSSYFGLVHAHCNAEAVRHFHWHTLSFIDE
ncbi:MAG: RNA-directed DNA polymerase [Candidatus Peribacteraceae bacterium]|nr:RNA-directed DNA polymerase [Candidatus Peribacteraceae bacterium]